MAILKVRDEQGNIIEIPAIKGDKGDKGDSASATDVQINGTSIVSDGVANIPMANGNDLGLVKANTNTNRPVYVDGNGLLQLGIATGSDLDKRNAQKVIGCGSYDGAVKRAMCDGKGTEWTSEEKAMARSRMGIDREPIVIDIETSEEVKQIDIIEHNGKPLSDYDLKQLWVFVEGAGGGSGVNSEGVIRINNYQTGSMPYLSVPNALLNNATKQYWGGYLDVRNGVALSNNSYSALPYYRNNVQMTQSSYMLLSEKNINKVTLQSNSTVMPVGTKFKVILK